MNNKTEDYKLFNPNFRENSGTSLWFALRNTWVENKKDSKILSLLNKDSTFYTGKRFEVAAPLYHRYLRRYKTLFADIGYVNWAICERTRSEGNFMVNERSGFGFVEVYQKKDKYYLNSSVPIGARAEKAGISYEDYKIIIECAVQSRDRLEKKKSFKKLRGEARTLAILQAESEGILNGKARISRKQSISTTKRPRIDFNVEHHHGSGN